MIKKLSEANLGYHVKALNTNQVLREALNHPQTAVRVHFQRRGCILIDITALQQPFDLDDVCSRIIHSVQSVFPNSFEFCFTFPNPTKQELKTLDEKFNFFPDCEVRSIPIQTKEFSKDTYDGRSSETAKAHRG
eukprot:TRINITY_DN2518_c0_g1_i1.p1 TRINITY_DN2518_c0_g1~~TRINITY_DN2518_c0_g1_i1.p1  ORF type:complete len:134 (+),score=26.00 TRINITY_DN2518_c0_g1_i1:184-585(+)